MYDNKIRLSQDVLEKAELIAQEWGLKNARAAVEAVFRKYADEYLNRQPGAGDLSDRAAATRPRLAKSDATDPSSSAIARSPAPAKAIAPPPEPPVTANDALSELDELLGL